MKCDGYAVNIPAASTPVIIIPAAATATTVVVAAATATAAVIVAVDGRAETSQYNCGEGNRSDGYELAES